MIFSGEMTFSARSLIFLLFLLQLHHVYLFHHLFPPMKSFSFPSSLSKEKTIPVRVSTSSSVTSLLQGRRRRTFHLHAEGDDKKGGGGGGGGGGNTPFALPGMQAVSKRKEKKVVSKKTGQQAAAQILTEIKQETEKKKETRPINKKKAELDKKWRLVLHDDDYHEIDQVIEWITEVI